MAFRCSSAYPVTARLDPPERHGCANATCAVQSLWPSQVSGGFWLQLNKEFVDAIRARLRLGPLRVPGKKQEPDAAVSDKAHWRYEVHGGGLEAEHRDGARF